LLLEKNIPIRDLKKFSRALKIPIKLVSSLNSVETINFLASINPHLVVYTGGGILRKQFIQVPSIGVLNAHSGKLPFWRGMNVIEWSMLYGYKPYSTIHFIDSGIDTGKILYSEELPIEGLNSLSEIRGMATKHNVLLLIKIIDNLSQFLSFAEEQKPEDGKQFFVMHEFLRKIVEEKINSQQSMDTFNFVTRPLDFKDITKE
jgi:methionyl-tRNA formyltransferase